MCTTWRALGVECAPPGGHSGSKAHHVEGTRAEGGEPYAGPVTDHLVTPTSQVGVEPATSIGRRSRWVLIANVVAQVGIVVSGGLVRLTGSGLGCPTWPECTEGSLVPVQGQSEGLHTFIEFGNRMLTFAVLVTAVVSLLVVLRPALARRFGPRWGEPGQPRRSLVLLASAVLLGIFGQAALGGITVLLDLHPAIVAAHFLLSMLMIAAAFTLYRRATELGDQPRIVVVRRELQLLAVTIVAAAFVVLVLGTIVTGTGPHSGDADEVVRFGLDPRTISWLHADAVLVFVGLALGYALGARLTDAPSAARRAGWLLIAACIVQGSIGYAQYFSGLPIGLVSVHMLGACLVWLAALNAFFSTRVRGRSAAGVETVTH